MGKLKQILISAQNYWDNIDSNRAIFYNHIFESVNSKQYFEKEIQNSISKTRCVHAIIMLDGENDTINDIINSAAMSSITYNFNQLTQDVSTYGY